MSIENRILYQQFIIYYTFIRTVDNNVQAIISAHLHYLHVINNKNINLNIQYLPFIYQNL